MIRIYLILFMILQLLWSCNSSDSIDELFIIKSDVTFDGAGGDGMIKFKSSDPVKVTSAKEWCTIKEKNDTVINLFVEINNSVSSRTSLVTIEMGDEITYVPVTQSGIRLILDENVIVFPKEGGVKKIHFSCPLSCEVIDFPEWLSCELISDTIIIEAFKSYEYERDVAITITTGTISETIYITQESGYFDPINIAFMKGSAWYFDPEKLGPKMQEVWDKVDYRVNYIYLGKNSNDVHGLFSQIQWNTTSGSVANYSVGYSFDFIALEDSKDELILNLTYVSGDNSLGTQSTFFLSYGGYIHLLEMLNGDGNKVYKIIPDDEEFPTELRFVSLEDEEDWFTLSSEQINLR